ncbi:protein-L-isoaspartate O-methyltransferase family protein [Teichococcus vastitatis]|uniref:protein-L-isoaspartate O-methyltransferase family protein n=1 Tax=Teichococcus vastitatis TaxID=2307076 RepID=UPI001EE42E16|nr:methyltransferase [Pseudoroseomonas vastitatis]
MAHWRAFYARYVAARGAVDDARVEQAFAAVPREPFAGPGPWSILAVSPWRSGAARSGYVRTPGADPAFLYQDVLVALDPARGINIGEPALHARCLDACAPQRGETVVQVGAGSGYYTAILCELVGPQGRVHAFEIDPDLARKAVANLAPWPWAEVLARSGTAEALPPADLIYVNAGITQPSPVWLDALRPGGRLLFPLQPEGGFGGMLLVKRPPGTERAWPAEFVSRASFIACQAQQDQVVGRKLEATFQAGGWSRVRSLRLEGEADQTCWLDGGSWWLSTASG